MGFRSGNHILRHNLPCQSDGLIKLVFAFWLSKLRIVQIEEDKRKTVRMRLY